MTLSSNQKAAAYLKTLHPTMRAIVIKELARRKRQDKKIADSGLFDISMKNGADEFFNEKLYAEAKPLFQAAIANLSAAGADIKELMRAVCKIALAEFGVETTVKMKPYIVRFIADQREGKLDAPATSRNSEQDRTHDPDAPLGGDHAVHAGSAGAKSAYSQPVGETRSKRVRPAADNLLHDAGTDVGREGRDYGVFIETGELRLDRNDPKSM